LSSPREMLEAICYELGTRFQVDIAVDVDHGAVLTADVRDQVGRIAREAIANAARHGAAKHVLVSLKPRSGMLVLRVVDDGGGITAQSDGGVEGFGIRSMRDRAAAMGGLLTIRSAGAGGTDLEVTFS
jgi:signal transduction histidine kinase